MLLVAEISNEPGSFILFMQTTTLLNTTRPLARSPLSEQRRSRRSTTVSPNLMWAESVGVLAQIISIQ